MNPYLNLGEAMEQYPHLNLAWVELRSLLADIESADPDEVSQAVEAMNIEVEQMEISLFGEPEDEYE